MAWTHSAAEIGKTAFRDARGGAGDGRISKMRGRHHADSSGVEAIKITEVALQRLRAFSAQKSGDSMGRAAGGEKLLQV